MQIKKYKLLKKIGEGGCSEVFLVEDQVLHKVWLMKKIWKTEQENQERSTEEKEIELLKNLSHPSIPRVVEYFFDKKANYYILDYIQGENLRTVMNEGKITVKLIERWMMELMEILFYLHNRQPAIFYGDLKPENIIVGNHGKISLVDFGASGEVTEVRTKSYGTKGYAAPEQFGDMGQTDARTDIYCLGATMYHLVTGHNPAEPPYEMYPITKWNPRLSTGLEQIIQKCTCKNPHDRYQSAKELKDALLHYQDMDDSAVESYRKKLKVFIGTTALSVLCLLASLGFGLASMHLQKDTYADIIEIAARTTMEQDALNLYMQAIDTDSTREEAYNRLCERIMEDGLFDDAEEDVLLGLNVSTKKYLRNFAEKNQAAYADFCYDIGNAYWFYYEHEESRQAHAVVWFEEAARIYETMPEKETKLQRSRLYVEIGSFHKQILAAQIDGSDAGMYGDYWRKLVAWKAMNDEQPDRELITLRMYRELVTRSMEYAKYLREDGISKQEILEVYASIEAQMLRMEQQATQSVRQEIEEIRGLLEGAELLLDSSYTNL